MTLRIRPADVDDRADCASICLRTGDAGGDATGLYRDPDLLALVYATPYLVLDEGFGLVAEDADGVAGYVLGTADTAAFEDACERHWWPTLRRTHPDPGPEPADPDARLHRMIHHPSRTPEAIAARYPAHLHIDLLPRLQGTGAGRTLMAAFLDALIAHGVPGVHLGVGRANRHAIGFYRHLGFETVAEDQHSLVLGRSLP